MNWVHSSNVEKKAPFPDWFWITVQEREPLVMEIITKDASIDGYKKFSQSWATNRADNKRAAANTNWHHGQHAENLGTTHGQRRKRLARDPLTFLVTENYKQNSLVNLQTNNKGKQRVFLCKGDRQKGIWHNSKQACDDLSSKFAGSVPLFSQIRFSAQL